MKNLKIFAVIAAAALCALFAACTIDTSGSLKELSNPYVNQYECTSATLGGEDILGQFDYIRVLLTDESNMQIQYKRKGQSAHSENCRYRYDEETHELTAEAGILGFKLRESVKIENGQFTLTIPISGRQLIMKFSS